MTDFPRLFNGRLHNLCLTDEDLLRIGEWASVVLKHWPASWDAEDTALLERVATIIRGCDLA
jgi:hypothetical protein